MNWYKVTFVGIVLIGVLLLMGFCSGCADFSRKDADVVGGVLELFVKEDPAPEPEEPDE